jgi:hypothetical protein
METLLVDENEIASSFIQQTAKKTGYAQILRSFKIDMMLLERLIVHPPVQGSHGTIPRRFHERRKIAFIDVNVDRLVAHFLCVIKDGGVLVGSKGVVGKYVVTGNQIGITDVGKGTGRNTNAKVLEEALGFEGLKERCGGTRVPIQAEIAATNWLIDDINYAVGWPLGSVKRRQVVSRSMILAKVSKLVMKCGTEEGCHGIQMEAAFRHVKEEDVIRSKEVERRQEAEYKGLSECGPKGDEDQCGHNEYVGESMQEDERVEEAWDGFYPMVPADGQGDKHVGAGHELG